MTSAEIRQRFLAFFEKRGHSIIPSASLVPENDPTVLFNTAGMQPLVPYLMGKDHPAGSRLANLQKCVRTVDIDDIGDNTHLTFFEMMGNWSLGDYFKREAIEWSFALLTDKEEGFGLDPARLYITCFEGNEKAKKDEESAGIWREIFYNNGIKGERIYFLGEEANWWPAVKTGKDTWTGPTGPCTEMFYDLTGELNKGMKLEKFLQADKDQKVVEIWNDVFMEYQKKEGKVIGMLEQKNVDTGSGFERVTMVLQNKDNVYDTDIFSKIIGKIDEFTTNPNEKARRIVADHIRTAVMLIADGVLPGNTDQGYVLRRLVRRVVRYGDILGFKPGSLFWIAQSVIDDYGSIYLNLKENTEEIKKEIDKEEQKFRKTLSLGLKEFERGIDPFVLATTYGFPIELTEELALEKEITINREEFDERMKEHQKLSRAGALEKFKGGLGDTSLQSVRFHTATHLLHQALREVLGVHVSQKGSNITPERLRFDFSHPSKMTAEEKKKVEEIVNEKIKSALPVKMIVLPKDEALKTGALHFFGDKYGENVSIYYVGDDMNSAFSKEFCGGPHVKNTRELGKFKILKEEAVGEGIRRIKAVLN